MSFFFIIFFASASFAMSGNTTMTAGESVCQLALTKKDGKPKSICTGTLIAPTQVATAGHCVDKLAGDKSLILNISCGFKRINTENLELGKTDKGTHFFTQGIEFEEKLVASEVFIDPKHFDDEKDHDRALIILKTPSKLTPTPVADRSDVYSQCKASGFGINRHGTAGLPRTADYNDIQYSEKSLMSHIYLQMNREKDKPTLIENFISAANSANPVRQLGYFLADNHILNAVADSGDSGGPLFCLVDKEWKLVGVLEGYLVKNSVEKLILDYRTTWAPYDRSEITQKIR